MLHADAPNGQAKPVTPRAHGEPASIKAKSVPVPNMFANSGRSAERRPVERDRVSALRFFALTDWAGKAAMVRAGRRSDRSAAAHLRANRVRQVIMGQDFPRGSLEL